jgi:threonine dehydrogenase-like Zn-dependent dehydrogenase
MAVHRTLNDQAAGECRALVSTAPGRAEYRAVPVPGELAGGGLGRVLAAGVCGSDLSLFRGGPIASRVWPHILGHETVVRVERSSLALAERWGVAPGDRVFVEEFIPCGWCEMCRSGRYRTCPRTDFRSERFLRYGRTSLNTGPGLWGGFSEYLYLHPDARLHPVPGDVAAERAVLATPIANGLRWVGTTAEAQFDDTVVVLGPGAHGLGCVVAAQEAGARQVILIGLSTDAARLAVGTSLGASAVARSDADDVEEEVRQRTDGHGAQVVIEATGAPEAAGLAVRLARHGGRVVLAGGANTPATDFPIDVIGRREVRVLGVRGHDGRDISRALRLLGSGRYEVDAMTAAPVSLADGADLLTALCSGGPAHDLPHHVMLPDSSARIDEGG